MAFVTEFLFAQLPLNDRRLIDNVLQLTHGLVLLEQLQWAAASLHLSQSPTSYPLIRFFCHIFT
jgi:hypothetical protein